MTRQTMRGWSALVIPLALIAGAGCSDVAGDAAHVSTSATSVDDIAEEVADRGDGLGVTDVTAVASSTARIATVPDGSVTASSSTTAPMAAPITEPTTTSGGSSSSIATGSVPPPTTSASTSTTSVTTSVTTTTAATTSSLNALLSTLVVEREPARIGYDRDVFDHWVDVDGNGCDARQDALAAQVIGFPQVDLFDRCVIVAGDWYSAYDAVNYAGSPSELDIDHVVALAEAWDSGADRWTEAQRRQFANDQSNLLAVTASSNRSKSDRDVGEWRPPARSSWCLTATITVEVKAAYALAIDDDEARALAEMLATCGGSDQYMPGRMPLPAAPVATETTLSSSQPSTTAGEHLSNCVDINTASVDELDRIIHIGPARADNIVALRPFASVDDLTRVSGISDGRLAEILEQGLACVR